MQTTPRLSKTNQLLVCFSHLRWDFVYQRPQHLLSRAARTYRTFYFEEPVYGAAAPSLRATVTPSGVVVLVPHLPSADDRELATQQQKVLLDEFLAAEAEADLTFWYYTPMALAFSDHVVPNYCVYDCMDELSAFRFAPPELLVREKQLLKLADIVFTGGRSLYEAKSTRHCNVHCFSSSVDKEHFGSARTLRGTAPEPGDQAPIPHPRVGFFGVIDERMNLGLVSAVAEAAPHLQIVMIGPTAKIDPAELPRRPNIHWLGPKQYDDLPAYLAGWDCGIMPFALNESTRFISPTKTPEFLAAGLPLVSTRITDVVRPYGELGTVAIADRSEDFVKAIAQALADRDAGVRLAKADKLLADMSWDATFKRMSELMSASRHPAAELRPSRTHAGRV
jgi:UDP-galactopyranose mutase